MVEGSGPIGLRRDPTAQTLREIGANSRPTRRPDRQVLRIIITGWLVLTPAFVRCDPRRSPTVTVAPLCLRCVTWRVRLPWRFFPLQLPCPTALSQRLPLLPRWPSPPLALLLSVPPHRRLRTRRTAVGAASRRNTDGARAAVLRCPSRRGPVTSARSGCGGPGPVGACAARDSCRPRRQRAAQTGGGRGTPLQGGRRRCHLAGALSAHG